MWLDYLTWKTLGALTSDASAEDRVAEKIPAEIRGAKPDTKLITCATNTFTSKYLYKYANPSEKLCSDSTSRTSHQDCDNIKVPTSLSS